MAEGVPTNNQRGRRSGPCRLWGGLDKARHIAPTALLVRVQCFRKSLHKAVQGPSTRPIVVSMINGSYCRRRRRLTIFEPDEMKFGVIFSSYISQLVRFARCCTSVFDFHFKNLQITSKLLTQVTLVLLLYRFQNIYRNESLIQSSTVILSTK